MKLLAEIAVLCVFIIICLCIYYMIPKRTKNVIKSYESEGLCRKCGNCVVEEIPTTKYSVIRRFKEKQYSGRICNNCLTSFAVIMHQVEK